MKEEVNSASHSFVMVESCGEEAGLSERETARLHGVRGTHSQGHVLA